MPELPDLTVYIEALDRHVGGAVLEKIALASPSLLHSVDTPLSAAEGRRVGGLRRIGKRIVITLCPADAKSEASADEIHLVFHLMIAGRFRWKKKGTRPRRKGTHAAFDFGPSSSGVPGGTLVLTEASTQKRASLHVIRGEAALAEQDPGGIEIFEADAEAFETQLTLRNHTLKRALTDPHLFAGIGNAYSDEILHRAGLSPVKLTQSLDLDAIARLYASTREVLQEWTDRLREQNGDRFPDKVTAFHPEMATHGKFGEPCPACGAKIQRIVYANNETNYCAPCQTGGRLLADRALSRLLKRDWPRSLDELEQRRADNTTAPEHARGDKGES